MKFSKLKNIILRSDIKKDEEDDNTVPHYAQCFSWVNYSYTLQ